MEQTRIVEVEGVGSFEIRRPVMRTAIAMEVEYARLTEGLEMVPADLNFICRVMSYLKVMVVSAPKDWNADDVDPYDEGEISRIREVYDALTAAEARFRGGKPKDAEVPSEGAE